MSEHRRTQARELDSPKCSRHVDGTVFAWFSENKIMVNRGQEICRRRWFSVADAATERRLAIRGGLAGCACRPQPHRCRNCIAIARPAAGKGCSGPQKRPGQVFFILRVHFGSSSPIKYIESKCPRLSEGAPRPRWRVAWLRLAWPCLDMRAQIVGERMPWLDRCRGCVNRLTACRGAAG